MKSARTYKSPLRAEQAAATRERILAGMARVLARGDAQEASYRAIAAAAGVTEITVYRHFPRKAELLRAFWWWLDRRLTARGMPAREETLAEDVRALFAAFDREEPLIRASLLSPQGRAMRQSMNAERQAGFEQALAAATRGLPARERRRAQAVVQLLFSGWAWLSMKDQWGLSGEESGEAAAWAIELIVEHLHRRPRKARRAAKNGGAS
jgi:AcrR family transcriptional regulator